MAEESGARHDPLAALRQPQFLLFSFARLFSGMATMLLAAALAWQVYAISGSAWQLAMIGVVGFIPSLGFSLVAGAVADRYDRRKLAIIAQGTQLAAAAGLAGVTLAGTDNLAIIYALFFAWSLAAAFDWPARSALLPLLVSRETFANAIVVSGTIQQLSFVSGPPLAGVLIAVSGVGLAYSALVALMAAAVLLMATLKPRPDEAPKRSVSFAGVMEGVRFVWRRQPVLGSMTLDMFAVIFGGATILLPIYAKEILDVGAVGYGLLLGAIDGGALVMSVILVMRPQVQRTGRTLLFAVLGFGLATMVFGASRWFPLSLLACIGIGFSDQISVVMRQTTIQLATPDALRGRVTSVNMLFIGASNRLGTVESGVVAAATNATFAVISGGAASLAVLGIVAAKMPELRNYRLTRADRSDDAEQSIEIAEQEEVASAAGG
ncbi:MAG: MFS transporter [Chloroflexi bacterium]|nr:MFS transporter [Chloroflexota bacterium]